MPVNMLHHFTILSDDVAKTARFFTEALGLEEGPAPKLDTPVIWIYCGGEPAIHIVGKDAPGADGAARIDHMGFKATDYRAVKDRLDAFGAEQMEQHLPAVGVHQVFAKSPEGVWIELIFSVEDYEAGKAA